MIDFGSNLHQNMDPEILFIFVKNEGELWCAQSWRRFVVKNKQLAKNWEGRDYECCEMLTD